MPLNAWAIGDIQGCFDEFIQLVELIDANAAGQGADGKPCLWLVGDLVNRGPKSLETIEWLMKHHQRCRIVLGNHDLNFLAVAAGVRKTKDDDTLDRLLGSSDKKRFVSWLRHQQLAHFEDGVLMVHAGVLPQWDVAMTLCYAAEIEYRLQSADWKEFLAQMYGNEPTQWKPELRGTERRRVSVNALTRLRFCSATGAMEFNTKESAGNAPAGYLPWFALPERRTREQTVVFGHWSTLGLVNNPRVIGLDTGCVWGGSLTAVNLDNRQLLQVASKRSSKTGGLRVPMNKSI